MGMSSVWLKESENQVWEAYFLPLCLYLSSVFLTYFQIIWGYAVTTENACISQILFKLPVRKFFVPAHPLISE